MKLEELFPESSMVLDLESRDKDTLIRELIAKLVECGRLAPEAAGPAETAVQERESQATTGIGRGLAIPHAKNCEFFQGIVGAFGRTSAGIEYDTIDGEPVQLAFLVLSSVDRAEDHVEIMKKVARLGRDAKTLRFLATNAQREGIVQIFREIDAGQL